jgi:DNA gyrase subunit B
VWNGPVRGPSPSNNINTTEGGAHLSGFKAALTGTLNKYARDKGLLKEKEENLEGDDVREGLAAVISVKLREPQFEGQTKTKLGNPWVRGLVEQTVNQRLAEFLEENPTDAKQIVTKAVTARNARQPVRKSAAAEPKERARAPLCRDDSPTVRPATLRTPSSSWSGATRPAVCRRGP